jgi:CBS domain-containing protein
MKVENVMKQPAQTCRAEDALNRAAQLMWEHDCGCVPIVQDDGCVVGMLTDRDICMAAYTRGAPLTALRVQDAMSGTICACHPQDTVADAERIMRANQVHRLPVIDAGGRLVGILSLNDLAQEAVREAAKRRRDVSLAEIGETLGIVCKPRRAAAIAAAA